MEKKEANPTWKFLLVVLVVIAIILLFWKPLTAILSNRENVREFIGKFGILGPIAFIWLIALQVLFSPVPVQVTGLASGYLFGAVLGTVYGMIGLTIGAFFAFYLSRKFGRPFVELLVSEKILNKFDGIVAKGGAYTLFLIYLLPALPDDAVCFIGGLTKIRIRYLMLLAAVGRLPGFIILNIVGAGIASENIYLSAAIFVMVLASAGVFYVNRERIKKFTEKIVKNGSKKTRP